MQANWRWFCLFWLVSVWSVEEENIFSCSLIQ